jgi:hypothetical protein
MMSLVLPSSSLLPSTRHLNSVLLVLFTVLHSPWLTGSFQHLIAVNSSVSSLKSLHFARIDRVSVQSLSCLPYGVVCALGLRNTESVLFQSFALTRSLINLTTPPCLSRTAHHVDECYAGLNDLTHCLRGVPLGPRGHRTSLQLSGQKPVLIITLSDNGLEV